ncbi:MAG: hypothetical protein ABI268_12695 [Rhodanobacter sp.]
MPDRSAVFQNAAADGEFMDAAVGLAMTLGSPIGGVLFDHSSRHRLPAKV